MGEKFWIDDPGVLFRKNNFYRILPTKNMGRTEMFNTLSRFFIYLSVLYILFSKNKECVIIPIVILVLVVFIYRFQDSPAKKEKFQKKESPTLKLYDPGRQFYTVPVVTAQNDQITFAKWLYNAPETCKENQSQCLKYEDLRFHK